MSATTCPLVLNHLITSLPQQERVQFLRHCEAVDLVFGSILCEPGQDFPFVYFPLTSYISVMKVVGAHPALELGMIGNEGVLGGTLVLGIDTASMLGVVQGSGTALRITLPHLKLELSDSPALVRLLKRHLYLLMGQLSQTAACNSFHEVAARLARWLLLSHDRSHADHFYLTHQFLADMLGVRRSAITIAAGVLRDKKLIRYARGRINILDRPGLEAVSCECYAAANGDLEEQLTIH